MKKLLRTTLLPAALISLATGSVHAVTVIGETTTDFDAATNANVVDGISSNVIGQTIAAWDSTVQGAATGTTGVIWTSGSPAAPDANATEQVLASSDTIDLSFAGGTKILTLDPSVSVKVSAFGSATAVSGSKSIAGTSGSETAYTFSFTLAGAGLVANEQISQFGLVYLGRSGAVGDLTVTGLLNGGGSIALTTTPTGFGQLNGPAEDTLFHFSAPGGDYFTGFSYASTAARENPFDDFGVVTSVVPEPASLGLLGIAGMALCSRRRKHA